MAVGKGHDLFAQSLLQLVVQSSGIIVLLPLLMLELEGDVHTKPEEPLRQGLYAHRLLTVGILFEILEIPAPVEDIETLLILSAEDSRTQSGATANHLPELDFTLDDLEENQVQDVRYVDTRIQHIHGNGYLRLLVTDFELVDEVLRIGDVVVNEDAEPRTIFGIEYAEPLDDELGVAVVVGEDDGLADTFPALNLQAVLHQVLQDGVHGVLVEDIAEYLVSCDVSMIIPGARVQRLAGGLILPDHLHLLLLLLGQAVVLDALLENHAAPLESMVVDQIPVSHGVVQFIGVVGLALLHLEDVVGAPVYFIPRRSGQADEHGVEIVEDGSVLAEDGPVSLVDDDQVEPSHGERLVLRVDIVDHRLVGTEDYPGSQVLVATVFIQGTGRSIGKQLHKVLLGLIHEAGPVGEEKDVLHPAVPHQHIHKGDGHPRLARSCRHDQEGLAMLLVIMLADRLDGHLLVMAVGDAILDGKVGDILPSPLLDKALEVLRRMETKELPGRIAQAVDDPGLETVGVIDDRTDAILILQAVGIEFGLMLPLAGRNRRLLRLDDCQRPAVPTEEDIIRIAGPAGTRHPLQFYLDACPQRLDGTFLLHDRPPRFPQHQVDIHLPGFSLGDVRGDFFHGRGRCHRLRGGGRDDSICRLDFHAGWYSDGNLDRAGDERLVERLNLIDHLELQKDGADYVVDVQEAEESLPFGHATGMSRAVADFSHIMYGHHHLLVIDERPEWLSVYQFEQRCAVRHRNMLHLVQRPCDMLQRLSRIHGAVVRVANLMLLRRRTEPVQRVEVQIPYVVEVPHGVRTVLWNKSYQGLPVGRISVARFVPCNCRAD